MRTTGLAPLAACLLLAVTACGAGVEPSDPDTPSPPATDLERLDRLWTDVASARFDLKYRETELIIDCLETEGFGVHNIEDMTQGWNHSPLTPSATLEAVDDPAGLPTTAEAETRALGIWLNFADTYEDQEGIDLREAEAEADESAVEDWSHSLGDLSALQQLGEGWNQLPAIDRMRWEIAYRGLEWAMTSKAASILSGDDWEALGHPDGEWASASSVTSSPQGCQAEVLGELYGEPRRIENDFTDPRWVWGPALEPAPAGLEPADLGAMPEADRLLECLAEAGYSDWTISDGGGLDFGGHWRDQYYPEATVEHEDGSHEFNYSDLTDADRERYETVKAAEFEAAMVVAACDADSGYTEAATVAYREDLTARLLDAEPAYRTYLADLEAALDA